LLNGTSAQYRLFSAINGRNAGIIYIKSNEYNITNNYNDKITEIVLKCSCATSKTLQLLVM